MIKIQPLTKTHIPEAAALFVNHYQNLRKIVPYMPDVMTDPGRVIPKLEWIINAGGGLAAIEDGRLKGYLTWLVDVGFRGTSKNAAYCPEWGHAASVESAEKVYWMLYHAASRRWTEAGLQLYALTYLVNNTLLDTFLYHNGFGMIVMDAIRSIDFQAGNVDPSLTISRCTLEDAALIAALDMEHCDHYIQPPTLMTPRNVETPESVREFLEGDHNAYWLAEENGTAAGFIRFEHGNTNASTVVRSDEIIAITGAYIRPQYRGRGAAPGIMQAALAEYAWRGFSACSVDYESINPDAYLFWPRYFKPVCHSVVRCPEKYL